MFNGPCYDPRLDKERLSRQMNRIYEYMIDGKWQTLSEIAIATGAPEASVSAQLRHLRKPRFGGYIVEKRRKGEKTAGLWEYRLLKPVRTERQLAFV